MEDRVTPAAAQPAGADLTLLIQWFESAEEASQGGRRESEQARDYYDGKQLSAAELKVLKRRRQPPVVINRIQRKIDYLRGLERQSRTDPKAYPRTPQHEQDAEACTDALRYVKADQSIDVKRSLLFENMLIEGFGGVEVTVTRGPKGVIDPKVIHLPWDRIFYDPHSSAHDFADARFMGFVTWMDVEEAKGRPEWQGKEGLIDSTMAKGTSAISDTYDDKPRWTYWADSKRKRIRVVTMYYQRGGQWMRCEFTLAGHLTDPAPSPFIDEDGKPECGMILQSAFVDRDNDRYGIVRNMISPQDEVNKRRSKALHLLNSRQVRVSRGGLDIEQIRREIARPDGVIEADPTELEVLNQGDFVNGHFQLMQEAKAEIDNLGPNATMQGKGQGQDQSGRAILALQQGGMVEMAPLLDGLRHLTIRLYRQIWNRIRQYWTEERWVRVTDDDDNVRFVGLNASKGALAMRKLADALKAGEIDEPTARQYEQQILSDPSMAEPANVVAELDVDIDIDEVNETPSLQFEQFQTLTSMAQAGLPIPPEVIIEASNLRNKAKLLKMLEQAKAQPNPQQELAQGQAQAQIAETQSKAQLNAAKAQTEQARLAEQTALAENEVLRGQVEDLALALNRRQQQPIRYLPAEPAEDPLLAA